ncbi:MAG: GNAT family protein, partial [Candidatus Promineifilaceae bacterium]
VADAGIYFALWTDPRVMSNVGFPMGLRMSLEEIEAKIREQKGQAEFGRNLVVELRTSESPIGECKMYRPGADGIARTDIKLMPEFWGHHYGVEIKRGLLAYLFQHTESLAVEATPNIQNLASIKMQEAIGGIRVGEEVYQFPESMSDYTCPVHHYVYQVYREEWEQRRDESASTKKGYRPNPQE